MATRPFFKSFGFVRWLLLTLIACSATAFANESDKFSFSGFGRIMLGYLDTDQANFRGYSDEISAKPESLLGLQASYEFNSELSATAQAIFRADEQYSRSDSVVNWAYLTWKPEDNVMLRLGRQRTPFFALSDVVDVGYAYPWATAPQQVYSAWLFPIFDGIDFSVGRYFGDVDTSFEMYFGQYDGSMSLGGDTTDYTVEKFGGVIGKATYNNFELRSSFHRGDVTVHFPDYDLIQLLLAGNPQTLAYIHNQGWFDVTQLSLTYDNFDYFTRLEWVDIQAEMSAIPDITSYYLSAGYNFNPVTLSLTYSVSDLTFTPFPNETYSPQAAYVVGELQGLLSDDSLRSWTVAARWDVRPKLALKSELTLLDGYNDKNSFFDSIQSGFSRDASLYKISIEWVF